ncbi:hypothetical protein BsWGS_14927 [Bradybaena similaris]
MTTPSKETNPEQDVQHLFRAIRKGKAHLTRFMLAASNNTLLNCWNADGRTPLIECCYIKEESMRGHMVRVIRDAGADVNKKDRSGKTALIHACEQKCNDIVKILIQHANICPDVEDYDGNTALIHAANAGNDIAVEQLVKSFRRLGLNVDHYNRAGYTALHVATINGFLQCAKILAGKGKASLTLKDKVHQMTPLEWCLNEGYQQSDVEFLKPSTKFYRVAKLTTTMAKYRKKSTQENLPSSEASDSPAEAVAKPVRRDKDLLRKSGSYSSNEAFLDVTDASSLSNVNRPADSPIGEMNLNMNSLNVSRDASPRKTILRETSSEPGRQRSLSQSDQQQDFDVAAVAAKAGLPHSHSHPITCKDLEISAVSQMFSSEDDQDRFSSQGCLTLPDEYGESDADDLESFGVDLDSGYLTSTISQGRSSHMPDILGCQDTDPNIDKPEGSNGGSSQCGSRDVNCNSSNYPLLQHSSDNCGSQRAKNKIKPNDGSIPRNDYSGSTSEDQHLSSDDTEDGFSPRSSEEPFVVFDNNEPVQSTATQPVPQVMKSNIILNLVESDGSQSDHIQHTGIVFNNTGSTVSPNMNTASSEVINSLSHTQEIET